MTLDKVFSPEGRWITFLGQRHIDYIKKKQMELPPGCRLILQKGDNPDRWAVYRDKIKKKEDCK